MIPLLGAGGLGEPIVTGLQLADTTLILSGVLPAALLAQPVDFALGRLERAIRRVGWRRHDAERRTTAGQPDHGGARPRDG